MPPPLALRSSGSAPSTKYGRCDVSERRLPLTAPPSMITLTVSSAKSPPPSAKRPLGVDATALLAITRESRIVSEPVDQTTTPPPLASLATPDASLCETVVRTSVKGPQVLMPPPRAQANGHGTPPGHGGPNGRVWVGRARLP